MKRILLAALIERALKQAYIPVPVQERDTGRKPWEVADAPVLPPVFVILQWADGKQQTLNDKPIPRAGEGGAYDLINKYVVRKGEQGATYREGSGGQRFLMDDDPDALRIFPRRIFISDVAQPVRR